METPQREKPLQILHLAMPRTGTVSMTEAYKMLGYTTYHGFDFAVRLDQQVQWIKAIHAKYSGVGKPFEKKDFDALLGEYEVLSDVPVVGFTEELLEMYPEAKVVLVERDVEKWYHSFHSAILVATYTKLVWILINLLDPLGLMPPTATAMRKLFYAMFNCHDQRSWEANARSTYRAHYDFVRKSVPKERLLDYELGSGWEPLCKFLGKEVPDCEFPRLNESKEFAIYMRKAQSDLVKKGLRLVWGRVGVPGLVVASGVLLWRLGVFS